MISVCREESCLIACLNDFSLSGGELFDRIAAEDYKMTEAEVINYMRQVCEGLKHMHENSIVHLDVKVSDAKISSIKRF
jgi:serine/threonine protein kinase